MTDTLQTTFVVTAQTIGWGQNWGDGFFGYGDPAFPDPRPTAENTFVVAVSQ